MYSKHREINFVHEGFKIEVRDFPKYAVFIIRYIFFMFILSLIIILNSSIRPSLVSQSSNIVCKTDFMCVVDMYVVDSKYAVNAFM